MPKQFFIQKDKHIYRDGVAMYSINLISNIKKNSFYFIKRTSFSNYLTLVSKSVQLKSNYLFDSFQRCSRLLIRNISLRVVSNLGIYFSSNFFFFSRSFYSYNLSFACILGFSDFYRFFVTLSFFYFLWILIFNSRTFFENTTFHFLFLIT